ncbi:MAG: beta-L-arabinofuranosidase domain-containing protein, partial [Planctomycetota bacterium]
MTLTGSNTARLIVIPAMILCATAHCAGVESNPDGRIQPFNYESVQLLDGRLKDQFEQVRDYYMALRDNDILKGFRERTGKVAPGKEIGGAYSARPLSFGQWLSGFARMYKATGDTAIRDKAMYLLNEWGKTISDDGSFYYSTKSDASHYIYEKFVGGLVDMYEYIGSENALTYLAKITDWAERELDRSKPFAGPAGEWYTLSENLY